MKKHPYNIKRPGQVFFRDALISPRSLLFRSKWKEREPVKPKVPEKELPETPDSLEFPTERRSDALAQLEAVLFLAKEPLTGKRLSQLADLPEGVKVRELVKQLNERYDQERSAIQVIEVAGGFQLRTRPEFAPWLIRMQEVPTTVQLSPPVLETLTIIAYKQPVLRADVEKIRGVQCGELIRQLLDRDLVKIVGRSEDLGRPFYYGTTKTFLDIFGLGSLNDLPQRNPRSE